jgi:hypothetical protein
MEIDVWIQCKEKIYIHQTDKNGDTAMLALERRLITEQSILKTTWVGGLIRCGQSTIEIIGRYLPNKKRE